VRYTDAMLGGVGARIKSKAAWDVGRRGIVGPPIPLDATREGD
jgi:hypothetical protein